jgi:uncharacterized protein
VFSIISRDPGFFNLLEKASAVTVQTAEAYARIADDFASREELVAQIRGCEHDGDEVTHRTLELLDKTFITPFDREDIQALIKRMDDVIDEIDAAAKRLILYRITELTPWFPRQAAVLVQATRLLADAVGHLRNLKHPGNLQEQLVEVHRLENVGDDNNHAAVAELYDTATDPILVMKWKEIYDLTERAIDRCEDVANAIEGIVLKNT